jgi:hypothetical protein
MVIALYHFIRTVTTAEQTEAEYITSDTFNAMNRNYHQGKHKIFWFSNDRLLGSDKFNEYSTYKGNKAINPV